MTFERGWWFVFCAAPAALLAPSTALADGTGAAVPIPGRHIDGQGRVLQDNCPAELTGPGEARCFSHRIVTDGAIVPLANPTGFGGNQVASAYNLPSTAKSGGAIVAVVDVGGYPNAVSDS